jgi:PhoPQ-activated pathogenicity-related protein
MPFRQKELICKLAVGQPELCKMKTPIPAFILLLLAISCQVPEQQTDQTTDFSLKTYVKSADPEFRFSVTDSWKFYWHDLKGDNFLEYVPNVGHGLHGSYAHPNLFSFYQAVISERDIPDIAWSIEGPSIRLEIDPVADYLISKWEVVNPEARDFRIYVTGEAWSAEPVEKTDGGSYSVEITAPETGYKAAMLEVIIDPESDFPLTFTTGTLVLPDLYPFQPFKPDPIR